MALLGCPKGHRVGSETSCLDIPWILTLEPRRAETGGKDTAWLLLPRDPARSSCLRRQLFGIEQLSFLPDLQRDGGDLAGQSQARHLWLHAFL